MCFRRLYRLAATGKYAKRRDTHASERGVLPLFFCHHPYSFVGKYCQQKPFDDKNFKVNLVIKIITFGFCALSLSIINHYSFILSDVNANAKGSSTIENE